MGLDYSFVVVTSTRRVDALLGAVAEHLEADDKARVLAAMPWTATVDRTALARTGHPVRDRRGIVGLKKLSIEHGLEHCFTFCFPPDDDLVAFKWPRPLFPDAGEILKPDESRFESRTASTWTSTGISGRR